MGAVSRASWSCWRGGEREAARRGLLDCAQESVDVTASLLMTDKFPHRCDPLTSCAEVLRASSPPASADDSAALRDLSVLGDSALGGSTAVSPAETSARRAAGVAPTAAGMRPAAKRWWEGGCLDMV